MRSNGGHTIVFTMSAFDLIHLKAGWGYKSSCTVRG